MGKLIKLVTKRSKSKQYLVIRLIELKRELEKLQYEYPETCKKQRPKTLCEVHSIQSKKVRL